MGIFSGAKAQITGQRAYRTHISANQMVNEAKTGEAKQKYAEAYRLYEAAFAAGPQPPKIHQGFAILLMRLGEFDRAGEVMRGISAMKPLTDEDWFDLRVNYAICLWRTGKLDEAIDTIRRAAKFRKNSVVYTTEGMFLADKARATGDFAEVEAFNREAMEYDDEDAGALDNMGVMYEGMMEHARAAGDEAKAAEYREQAEAYYARAHARKPRQISTIYSLARMYHEDGEDAKAREVLESADDLYYSAVCPVTEAQMRALIDAVG